jgi:fructokinase
VAAPQIRIGIDLGGTKIEGIALDRRGTELWRRRIATPQDYEMTLEAVAGLVAAAEGDLGKRGAVGLGIPGAISPATGVVKNANSTWLIGRPLDRDLAALLGREVRVTNDANCFTLSEAVDGAGEGFPVVFGVILGTGVGGGIAIDGRVIEGAHSIAGEWGHNPLPRPGNDERPGPACYCGRSGCIETYLSGPGMELDHRQRTGVRLTTMEIARLADDGDSDASVTIDRYEERLGRSLATVVNILDPDVVVLGGGMSNLSGLAEAAVAAMAPHLFTDQPACLVRRNVHGDSSGVRGAAWQWGRD